MAGEHKKIVLQIQMDWSKENRGRLFENDNGMAWIGKILNESVSDNKKHVEIWPAIKIRYGLKKGCSDLVGFELINNFPIVCCIEVKTKRYKKLSDDQIEWLDFTKMFGGRAYVARESEEGYDLIEWEGK